MQESVVQPHHISIASRRVGLAIGALAAVAAGCGDAPTGPRALVIAGKTEAALQVAAALPTLPRLIESTVRQGAPTLPNGDSLVRAEALWREAQGEAREPVAAKLRESAYRLAVPALAARLDVNAVKQAHAALEAWLDTATPAVERAGLADLTAALADGRDYLARARAAQARGDAPGAVQATLRAADRLLATSPQAVSERLLRVGEAALATRRASGTQEDEREQLDLRRADRLLRGARQALKEADYTRAIHRAYYAVQLLE